MSESTEGNVVQRAKITANLITQTGFRLAKERKCKVDELGITPTDVAGIVQMVLDKELIMKNAHILFEAVCDQRLLRKAV